MRTCGFTTTATYSKENEHDNEGWRASGVGRGYGSSGVGQAMPQGHSSCSALSSLSHPLTFPHTLHTPLYLRALREARYAPSAPCTPGCITKAQNLSTRDE